jgi:hypothetical protein
VPKGWLEVGCTVQAAVSSSRASMHLAEMSSDTVYTAQLKMQMRHACVGSEWMVEAHVTCVRDKPVIARKNSRPGWCEKRGPVVLAARALCDMHIISSR